MPELPEVRTVASFLNNDVQSKKITSVKVNIPKMVKEMKIRDFTNAILNTKVEKVNNHGKFLLFHLSNEKVMLSHLRMEGKYRFEKTRSHQLHDDVVFGLEGLEKGFLVFSDTRKFGTFHIRSESDYLETPPLNKLGPEPQEADLNLVFQKTSKRKTAIKTVLLDQTVVRGLGNIYVDEVLFNQKINPLTPSCQVTKNQLSRVLEAASRIMDQATKEKGSSIRTYLAYNTIPGNYQNFLRVHMRLGKPCVTCQTRIRKMKVNGRGTYYCPSCQQVKTA